MLLGFVCFTNKRLGVTTSIRSILPKESKSKVRGGGVINNRVNVYHLLRILMKFIFLFTQNTKKYHTRIPYTRFLTMLR